MKGYRKKLLNLMMILKFSIIFIMDEFEKELEGRIALMEDDGYSFPKRFSKGDYLVAALVALVCAAALVAGGVFL